MGFELAPDALWQAQADAGERQTGLLSAAVQLNGCSAGFISPDGLLITNFHCVFGALQQASTATHNLIDSGFLAAGRAAELPGVNLHVLVPLARVDVTAALRAVVPPQATDRERQSALRKKADEIEAACRKGHERQADHQCRIVAFAGGLQHVLLESLSYPDVRLVYAPPRGIGDFGGDADNWTWPRHAADIALLRVWAAPDGAPAPRQPGNTPLHPPRFFAVSPRGVEPGSFVFAAGYPGTTSRARTAAELSDSAELFYRRWIDVYGAWQELMQAAVDADPAARLALADRLRRTQNYTKNARGQVDGLRRGKILEGKREQEAQVLSWAATRPQQADAAAAYRQLAAGVAERHTTWDRDFLLDQMRYGPKPLDLALALVRRAREAAAMAAADGSRRSAPAADRTSLAARIDAEQSQLHPPTEKALLGDLLCRFAALPPAEHVAAAAAWVPATADAASCRAAAAAILDGSRVADAAERLKMADESADQLRARHDPLLDLASALDGELVRAHAVDDEWQLAAAGLRRRFLSAELAWAGRPVAPDGNETLRVTFGQVKGYSPQDGVWMMPQTTLAGLRAKDTGLAPFNAPASLHGAAGGAAASRFADRDRHDLPICFLADIDTGQGSSGSPVLNSRGELVGVVFDRVWESITNDYAWSPDLSRSISVDIRYPLWLLAALGGAAARTLLAEMGIQP